MTTNASPRPVSSVWSAGSILSQSKCNDSCHKPLVKTINGLFKAEVIYRRGPWRSFEAVAFVTLE